MDVMNLLKTGLFFSILFSANTACASEPFKYASESAKYLKQAIEADKACKWIAKTVKWDNPEKMEHGYSFKLHVGEYFINVPSGIRSIIMFRDRELAIVYPDKSTLYLSTQIAPYEYNLNNHSDFRTNKIAPAEVAEAVFMKTHCDKADIPKYEYDKFIWNYAMYKKTEYFGKKGGDIFKTESGKLTYYFAENGYYSPTQGSAIVTNIEKKYDVLMMGSTGMSLDKFKKIVFSVTPATYSKKD